MAATQKDTIYIDVDDEITSIIEKVQDSNSKIIALVLPKRASVFQSIVNMKLLKRTADTGKKNIVLITSESNLLPLAGAVGLHVANTLQSKPAIPSAPAMPSDAPVSVDSLEVEELADVPLDKSASIGQLAGQPEEETIEIDNDDTSSDNTAKSALAAKLPFNKKLKVPDFNRFRNKLFLGAGVLALLIVGWVFAAIVLPRATITIKTDTTDVLSKVTVTTSPATAEANIDEKSIPGTLKELKKTDTQKVPATGQKDMGEKASGSVTLALNNCDQSQVTVPAGTTVTSGTFNFITQVDATMQSVKFGNQCRNSDFKEVSTATVKVVAQNPGDGYNLSARNYSVAGFAAVSGAGTAMSGGVSKVVKVVSQADIDGAKQKMIEAFNSAANPELVQQLKAEAHYPLTDTFLAKEALVIPSPAVDSEAAEVTVNVTQTFTMVGAKEDSLKEILETDIKRQIDASKQNILDNGLGSAAIRIDDKKPSGETRFTLETTAKAGVEQNESVIKQAVAGKKKNEVKTTLQSRPGVKDVTVKYGPFWVSKAPKSHDKIKLIFEQQTN